MQMHTAYTRTRCVPFKRKTGNWLETHIPVILPWANSTNKGTKKHMLSQRKMAENDEFPPITLLQVGGEVSCLWENREKICCLWIKACSAPWHGWLKIGTQIFQAKCFFIGVLFLVLKSVAAAGPVSSSLRLLVCHLYRFNCWICLFNLQEGAANGIYSAVLQNIIQGSVCSNFCMSINIAKENVLTHLLVWSGLCFFIVFICF